MVYENIRKARFLERPNRFIAQVELDGKKQICHVKNTGRCKELLVPGVEIYVQEHDNSARKTKYSLIAVQKGKRLINIDSQAPNKAAREWLEKGGLFPLTRLQPESRYHDSRLDFYLEGEGRRAFMEVKGVTLEEDGVVLFPDAPTQRGIKHLRELSGCVKEGYEAYLLFVIQMKGVSYFTPNRSTHPQFADALAQAQAQGVQLIAMDCQVTPERMVLADFVEIKL